MKVEDISVSVRIVDKSDSKVKAHADVGLAIDGFLEISGFAVIQSEGGLRVVPPSRKGKDRYFDMVAIRGKIKGVIEEAVLGEYRRVLKAHGGRNS